MPLIALDKIGLLFARSICKVVQPISLQMLLLSTSVQGLQMMLLSTSVDGRTCSVQTLSVTLHAKSVMNSPSLSKTSTWLRCRRELTACGAVNNHYVHNEQQLNGARHRLREPTVHRPGCTGSHTHHLAHLIRPLAPPVLRELSQDNDLGFEQQESFFFFFTTCEIMVPVCVG